MFLSRARRSGVIVRNGAMSAGHGYLKGISRGVGDIPQCVSGELLIIVKLLNSCTAPKFELRKFLACGRLIPQCQGWPEVPPFTLNLEGLAFGG